MPFHTIYMTIILMVLERFFLMYFPFYLNINPLLVVIFSFFKDLRDHQYDIENFFYDCNHDRSLSMSTSFG